MTQAMREYIPGWTRAAHTNPGVFVCPRCKITTTVTHTLCLKAGAGYLRYLCTYCWHDADVGERLRWCKQVLGEAGQMNHWAECAAAIWASL